MSALKRVPDKEFHARQLVENTMRDFGFMCSSNLTPIGKQAELETIVFYRITPVEEEKK